jgi:hypothetical protein
MYTYENPTPIATTLEDTSMKNNVILLLDTYF